MQYRTGFCAFCCPPPLFGALHTGLTPCFWLCRLIGRTAILSDGFRVCSRNLFWVAVLQAKKNIVENPYGFPLPSLILLPISFLFTYKNILLYIIQSVYNYIQSVYILYIIILYASAREKYFVIQGSKLCYTTYFWPICDFSLFML